MIQEDMSLYENERVIEHPAYVIGYLENAVLFEDDFGRQYTLRMEDPHIFDIGVVEDADGPDMELVFDPEKEAP